MAISRPSRSDEEARIASYYIIPDVSNIRKAFIFVSDSYNDLMNRFTDQHDYDEVLPRVYLGRIPCVNGFTIPSNLGLVVSVVAYQEIAGKGLYKTVYSPEDWKQKGIEHMHVNMPDMTADVFSTDVLESVTKIREFLEDPNHKDRSVYVHCKAGRARSAMLVATYLAIYGHPPDFTLTGDAQKDLNRALDYIQLRRPHVDVDTHKIAKAFNAITLFRKKRQPDSLEITRQYDPVYAYLASLDAKDSIRKFTSFKELAKYATEIQYYFSKCHRAEHVRELFSSIMNSTDGTWYDQLQNDEGPTNSLLMANKGEYAPGVKDKAHRRELIDNFKLELAQHLQSKNLLANDRRELSSC